MLKTVFRFFILGVTVLMAANSSQASSFEYQYGELRPTSEVTLASAVEPLAWVDYADNQVALTGHSDGKDGDGKGKGCGDGVGNWRDNTVVWFGGDAYKSLGDTGRPNFNPNPFALGNSFGLVTGFNTGFALGDSRVRAQLGGSYGVYDFKGRTTTFPVSDDSLEQQTFVTAGFYKRGDVCCGDRISWGAVYDWMGAHQWGWAGNELYLGQVRLLGGYAINECNEIGVWGTFQAQDDSVALNFPPTVNSTDVRAKNQLNTYWRHNWAFGGNTNAYVGVLDSADNGSWLFGLLGDAPLSNNVSLYGNFTYVAAGSATGLVGASEEQWNVGAGLQFFLGGKAVSPTVTGNAGLPLLPVANNGSFLVTD